MPSPIFAFLPLSKVRPRIIKLLNYIANTSFRTTTMHQDLQQNLTRKEHLELHQSPKPESSWPQSLPHLTRIAMTHLDSCANLVELNQIHAQMIRTQMLELYPSPFHWNCIMRSYLRFNLPQMALYLYVEMSRSGISPDSYTLPIVLKAVCRVFALELGWQFHSLAVKYGLELDEYCESGLISVYAKAGDFEHARKVFDKNGERKLGSWNALLNGLAQGGRSEEAINLFMEMRKCGFVPDDLTMVSVASACGSLGDLNLAQQVHKCVLQAQGPGRSDVQLSNTLVDMYGKCGRTDLAKIVFSRMIHRNVSSWTAMIMSLAMHGHVNDALDFFHQMKGDGIRPNYVTFVSVLSACAHGGLVDEARDYFDMMVSEYGIEPTMVHYGCMVDLFGRDGRVVEAKGMVERMHMRANSVILGTLLGACEKHGSVEVGEWVASKLIELEPWNDGVYVVLSNIYAGAGMWGEVERVRSLMREKRVAKTPGYSLATVSVQAD